LGVLHHQKQKRLGAELTAPRIEGAHQMNMRKAGSALPACELRVRVCRVGRHELDGRLRKTARLVLSEKYAAVVGCAEEAAQRERAVDDQTFPLRPALAHGCTFRPDLVHRCTFASHRTMKLPAEDITNSKARVCAAPPKTRLGRKAGTNR